MLDVHVLADQVSHFLKTEYQRVPREKLPFNLAFTRVMDSCGVLGKDRISLKKEIGSILAARPRKAKKKPGDTILHPAISLPTMTFVVVEANRRVVVLRCQMMGDNITYRRNGLGQVIYTASTGHPPQVAIALGLLRAEEIFKEMDSVVVRDELIYTESQSDDLITLIIGEKYKMVACRGMRGDIIAQASELQSGKPLKQNEIPKKLVSEARGIARLYFKDIRTRDMFVT